MRFRFPRPTPLLKSAGSKCAAGLRLCSVGLRLGCVVCFAIAGFAQGMQAAPQGTLPDKSGLTAPAPPTHAASARKSAHARRKNRRNAALKARRKPGRKNIAGKKAAPAPSPAHVAARPATVSLQNGKLMVEADNSDLSQILREVAGISGMTIDGLDRSARIFGAYGPGNPRDVLSHLLAGSGYNFIMVGNSTGGAPRQLLLTARNDSAAGLPPASTTAAPAARPAEPNGPAHDALAPASPADTADTPEDRDNRMRQTMNRLEEVHQQQQQNAPQ